METYFTTDDKRNAIESFLQDSDIPCLILEGSGGNGKSYMIHEFILGNKYRFIDMYEQELEEDHLTVPFEQNGKLAKQIWHINDTGFAEFIIKALGVDNVKHIKFAGVWKSELNSYV
jgi:hypothetical protein